MKKNFHKNMLITGACLALLFGGIVNVRAIAPEEYEAVRLSIRMVRRSLAPM